MVDGIEHPIETLDVCFSSAHNMLRLALQRETTFLPTSTSESAGDPPEASAERFPSALLSASGLFDKLFNIVAGPRL
jgi:hypothetical protein